jgi:multidrug efflux pump subunit AcrA (membrane-fusion protein)
VSTSSERERRPLLRLAGDTSDEPSASTGSVSEAPSESTDPEPPADGRRHRRWWLVALVGLVAMAGGGFWIGSRVQSPEQAASNAAEPDASWITAGVEYRVLSQTVITRGDVRPQIAVGVAVPSSVEGAPVLTGVAVSVGDEVVEGARLVEVSGRPVFVMVGDVPVYRSLRPGMSGADVTQLQDALGRLGFAPDTDGVYGQATKDAVAAFYEQAGYAAVPASASEAADRAAAEQALSDAEAAVVAAQTAVTEAAAGQPGSVVAQAEASRNQAQRALDDAKAAQTTEVALATQSRDVAARERDRVAANPEAGPGALDQAQLALNQAQAQLDQTRRTTQDAVDAANEALWIAAVALDEATTAGDATEAQTQLDAAIATRDRARAALDAVVAASGATVAQGEIVFVPTLPARVQQAAATLGDLDGDNATQSGEASSGGAGDGLVTLAGGDLVVSVSLRPDEVGLVRVGMGVELLDEQSNVVYPATISEVAETPVVGPDGQSGVPVVITADEVLPDSLSGANLRVTINAASTEAETLVVPLAAVSSSADGSTNVSVLPADAGPGVEPVAVAVTTGLSADGFVAVEPVNPDSLAAGDQVVVGR